MNKKVLLAVFVCLLNIASEVGAESLRIAILGAPKESVGFKTAKLMAHELGQRMGVELILVPLPGKRSTEYLKAEKIDGDWSRVDGFGKDMPGLIKVIEPMSTHPFLAYATKDIKINGWKSLESFRVVHLRGWKLVARELSPFNKKMYPVDDVDIALSLLMANRADVLIHVPYVMQSLLKRDKYKNSNVKALQPPLAYLNVHAYLLKKHTKWAVKMSAAIKSMKKDGTYNRLVFGKQVKGG
mgnify:CR=1 FL=1